MDFRYDKNTEQLILTEATRIEYNQLKLWLTRNPQGYRWTPAFKAGYWDGKDTEFEEGKINQGLWKECLKASQLVNTKFNIVNKEDFPLNRDVTIESVLEFCKEFFKNHKRFDRETDQWVPFVPYDHQIEVAFRILRNRYCLAEVATSGGKSLIISIVFFYTLSKLTPDAKMLLIVPSISLVTQFFDDIIDYNIGKNKEIDGGNPNPLELSIEEIMSEKPRKHSNIENPNICIGTYQSLINYPKSFFKQFHTVVCDESHKAKAKSLKTILKSTFGTAYNRYGVSGTFPSDESMEILNIQSVMGPKVSLVEAKTLVNKGIITPMEVKAIMLNHNDKEFNEKLKYVKKAGGGKQAYLIEREYIHLSDKRLDFISKIIKKCDNNTLILFYTIEYGKKILELQNLIQDKEFYYIDGEVKEKDRKVIKSKMDEKTDKPKILVASYGCLSTGVSINNLFNCVFADSFKSESTIVQSIGRVLRLFEGKDKAVIFDLVDVFETDPNNIFYRQFLERQKAYNKREYPCKITKINL